MTFILGPITGGSVAVPRYLFRVPAGFPSPAADHMEQPISLDELLNLRAPHIYLVRIDGDSMQGAGIFDGDLVLVDRSIEARHGHIVIAAVNGEPLCKRLQYVAGQVLLRSENPRYAPRYLMEGDDFMIWGVVTFSVRSHEPA
ncbi:MULTISPECIES: LexA family protein [Pseudomonas]|uniref:LexA family protein n=1 Tax=Pseudomonas TaxID=286 RepID=UPI001596922B|nr:MULTISPECIES: translesion error-prone DNA polymerase V autoproteolytic subunit [Pseudomonas]